MVSVLLWGGGGLVGGGGWGLGGGGWFCGGGGGGLFTDYNRHQKEKKKKHVERKRKYSWRSGHVSRPHREDDPIR